MDERGNVLASMEDFAAFLVFVTIAMITPGPNTVSSANYAILYGYKKTHSYRLGIFTGFAVVMLLCAFLAHTVASNLPSFAVILRYIGAAYIVYLAWGMLRATYEIEEGKKEQLAYPFLKGSLLQILNVKVLVLGISIYSTYLSERITSPVVLPLSAILLAGGSLAATNLWALAGSAIAGFTKHRAVRIGLNVTLSLLLLYSAYQLSGLAELF
ncbi:MAG: LysE family translocator [Spirochaetaceae bacterium]